MLVRSMRVLAVGIAFGIMLGLPVLAHAAEATPSVSPTAPY